MWGTLTQRHGCFNTNGSPKSRGLAPLDEPAALYGRIGECVNWDHGQRSASYSEQRLGYGCDVSAASINAPLACAVAVILWGPDASSDRLRARARCTSCGNKGAIVQHPGWAGNHIGFCPFPTDVG